MENPAFDDEKLQALYEKVVEEPKKAVFKKNSIVCPECGEEILMVPTLRVMNEAIENHVNLHREQLKANPIKAHQTAIRIRIALMGQVLQKANRLRLP